MYKYSECYNLFFPHLPFYIISAMKLIIILFSLVLMTTYLEAYCIYNKLTEDGGNFWIRQQPDNAGGDYTS